MIDKIKIKLVLKRLLESKLIIIVLLVVILLALFGINQVLYLKKAHSSFENYYAFRGCTELLGKTDDSGFCKLANGHVIKLVKYQDRWFLDGDLPCGFLCW